MASANVKANCFTCGKERATSKCGGCSQDFCYKHLGDHRQELGKQLDGIEVTRDVYWQTLNEHKSQLRNHSLIETINRWEQDSIEKIRQTAAEAQQSVHEHLTQPFTQIEDKLKQLTDQLRRSREKEDFFESDLYGWEKELSQLAEQLSKPPSKIEVHDDQITLIKKICVTVTCDDQEEDIDGNKLTVPNADASEFCTVQSNANNTPRTDSQLVRLFKSVNDSEIIKYIREHMDPNEKFYIRNIILSYLEACLINCDPQKKIQEDIAKRRMTVLNATIEHKPEAEIQAVYAIQNIVHKREHPSKMARVLFDLFHDEECVSEDALFEWLKHPDQSETEEHSAVAISAMEFFTWLQKPETDSEEEEN